MSKSEKSIFTPERTVRFFFVDVITIAIAGFIIWPLIDWIMNSISGKSFEWGVKEHIISPAVFALIIVIIEFIGWNLFHKSDKK